MGCLANLVSVSVWSQDWMKAKRSRLIGIGAMGGRAYARNCRARRQASAQIAPVPALPQLPPVETTAVQAGCRNTGTRSVRRAGGFVQVAFWEITVLPVCAFSAARVCGSEYLQHLFCACRRIGPAPDGSR